MKKAFTILSGVILCGSILAFNVKETGTPEIKISKAENVSQLEKANWLIGKWNKTSGATSMTENWEKVDNTHYKGHMYYIMGGTDTIMSRKLEMFEKAGKVTYTMVLDDENNGKPIPFTMTSVTPSEIVFENKGRDYPKKVTYKKTGANSMVSTLSGIKDGKPTSGEFAMKRQ